MTHTEEKHDTEYKGKDVNDVKDAKQLSPSVAPLTSLTSFPLGFGFVLLFDWYRCICNKKFITESSSIFKVGDLNKFGDK